MYVCRLVVDISIRTHFKRNVKGRRYSVFLSGRSVTRALLYTRFVHIRAHVMTVSVELVCLAQSPKGHPEWSVIKKEKCSSLVAQEFAG